MPGIRLKNYAVYLQKLLLYSEAMGLRVFSKTDPGDGSFDHNNNSITIDPDLAESSEIATLLHELGHAFDYHLLNDKISPKIWAAYDKVYSEAHNDTELQTVIDAEIRAWENGKVIAKRLKIPLGKWYAYERKTALTNYRKA